MALARHARRRVTERFEEQNIHFPARRVLILPPARPVNQWVLTTPYKSGFDAQLWSEDATQEAMLDFMRPYHEIPSVGLAKFQGNLGRKKELWSQYASYMVQAESYLRAARRVENRSACLLYYYAFLNYAKAELLPIYPDKIHNKRIMHGLSYNPAGAKTFQGDSLVVKNGVFSLLYQARTGKNIAPGIKLPIKLVARNIPELGSQLTTLEYGPARTMGVNYMIARDHEMAWTLLAISGNPENLKGTSRSSREFFDKFKEVAPPLMWREQFGFTRRLGIHLRFFELIKPVPIDGDLRDKAMTEAHNSTVESLRPLLDEPTSPTFDATLCPSIYKSRDLLLPASLARYVLMYYASSLVRYKPQLFGPGNPGLAFLFDTFARESSLPLLQNALSGIRGGWTIFAGYGAFRH